MKKLCFLVHEGVNLQSHDNAAMLSNAAEALGWEVWFAKADSLGAHDANFTALCCPKHIAENQSDFSAWPCERTELSQFDALWVLSLGTRHSFLDKLQLLEIFSRQRPVINSPNVLMHVHSKYHLLELSEMVSHPESFVSNEANTLLAIVESSDEPWILKPPAESYGQNVHLLTRHAAPNKVLVEELTKNGRYAILQRYIPQIEEGEKRVLLAAGKVIGHYKRYAIEDHRTNMHHGARAEACELNEDERTLCERLGWWLTQQGGYFVGLDMAYPYILECNVISPGGLGTIKRLIGKDFSKVLIEEIFAHISMYK